MTEKLPDGFDAAVALDMACASRAVYDMPLFPLKVYLDSKRLRDPNTRIVEMPSPTSDAFAVTILTEGKLYIIFRGTRSRKNLFTDMDVVMVPLYERAKVHRGFFNDLCALWPLIRKEVFAAMNSPKRPLIIIAGHSLGAGIGALCADRLWRELWIGCVGYTFGQPRVGNRAWRQMFDYTFRNWYRMIHCDDVVARIPRLFWFYVQTQIDMYFDSKDGLHIDLPSWRKFPGDIRRMWRHHWVDFDILLADHGIQQYCELLQRKWGAPYAG